jgi:hypothetical protein
VARQAAVGALNSAPHIHARLTSAGADLVAEAGEFAVDTSVSPRGVRGGPAEDNGAQAGGNSWSTGPVG